MLLASVETRLAVSKIVLLRNVQGPYGILHRYSAACVWGRSCRQYLSIKELENCALAIGCDRIQRIMRQAESASARMTDLGIARELGLLFHLALSHQDALDGIRARSGRSPGPVYDHRSAYLPAGQAFSSDLIFVSAASIPAVEFSTAHVYAGLMRSEMMPHVSPELKHSMSAYIPSTLKHSAIPPSIDAVTSVGSMSNSSAISKTLCARLNAIPLGFSGTALTAVISERRCCAWDKPAPLDFNASSAMTVDWEAVPALCTLYALARLFRALEDVQSGTALAASRYLLFISCLLPCVLR